MKNTVINLQINNASYANVPIEYARAIETMLAQFKVETKATAKVETPKATPKAKAEAPRVKVYALCEDGKSVTIGGDGFIPTKVFKGVTYSLKQSGAKYDAKTKAWTFENKTKCKAWCKEQDARA